MVDGITRNPFPAPLRKAVDSFEEGLSSIGYVSNVNAIYGDGRMEMLSWDDPEGHRCAFRDSAGWYAYERL